MQRPIQDLPSDLFRIGDGDLEKRPVCDLILGSQKVTGL